jgi:hypothetical protein
MTKKSGSIKTAPRQAVAAAPAKTKTPAYEPPALTKFDKLDKLIVCGE